MPQLKQSKIVPRTERPQIPDYGISKSKNGLLPWEWAAKTLTESREYWIVTVRPDGRPHAMIIWGLWFDGGFWFGTGRNTQKARNLAKNPNYVVGTQNATEAVILEGVAELITNVAMHKKLKPTSRSASTELVAATPLNPSIVCDQNVYSALSKKAFQKPLPAGYSIDVNERNRDSAIARSGNSPPE